MTWHRSGDEAGQRPRCRGGRADHAGHFGTVIISGQRSSMRSIARTLLVASTVIVTSVALAAPASAHNGGSRTVRPGQSIQAAVDAARPGDTVVVLGGTYRQQVRVSTNRVALRARGKVTIMPPSSGGGRCDVIAPTGICVLPRDLNTDTMAYGSR